MSFSLRHDPDFGLIVLIFRDSVTMETIKEVAPLVARMSADTGCRRILNDMSQAAVEVSFVELFSSPTVMDQSGISRATRRALVIPPGFKEMRFLENVSRNRGHDLKVFYDVEEAKKWLLSDSDGVKA